MAFEGFELSQVEIGDLSFRVRHGGSGPPLLLLHGYPETHLAWGPVAAALAADFTLVVPDLRGYGDSGKPSTVDDHTSYSKRAMGEDCVALMDHFGHSRFDVAGHDRGARVGYRLALDHPDAVRRLTVLDIIPTGEVWARADDRFAMGYWHWTFLAQPYPVPETAIGHDPDWFFFDAEFGGIIRTFEPIADYSRCARDPAVIHGICEDYRAGATYDRRLDEHDRAAGRKIACPTQALWSADGALARWYDPLEIWRDWADDVIGQPIDGGHFLPEENPAATLTALRSFHG